MGATDTTPGLLRIGEVARLVGTTPRTIRYYEEIGLLPDAPARDRGRHRLYSEADVEWLRELLRLKDLLGVSLEELKELVEAEGARAELRREWHGGVEDPVRRREILEQSLTYTARQLELVRRRREEIAKLEDELIARRRRVRNLLRETETDALGGRGGGPSQNTRARP
jgi:DNA-binding transcriptional MerR regulator